MYIYMYVCLYVRMYVRTCVCMYVCICVCVYVQMYVCMYVYVSVCTCVYIYTSVCIHTHLCTYTHKYACQSNGRHFPAVPSISWFRNSCTAEHWILFDIMPCWLVTEPATSQHDVISQQHRCENLKCSNLPVTSPVQEVTRTINGTESKRTPRRRPQSVTQAPLLLIHNHHDARRGSSTKPQPPVSQHHPLLDAY